MSKPPSLKAYALAALGFFMPMQKANAQRKEIDRHAINQPVMSDGSKITHTDLAKIIQKQVQDDSSRPHIGQKVHYGDAQSLYNVLQEDDHYVELLNGQSYTLDSLVDVAQANNKKRFVMEREFKDGNVYTLPVSHARYMLQVHDQAHAALNIPPVLLQMVGDDLNTARAKTSSPARTMYDISLLPLSDDAFKFVIGHEAAHHGNTIKKDVDRTQPGASKKEEFYADKKSILNFDKITATHPAASPHMQKEKNQTHMAMFKYYGELLYREENLHTQKPRQQIKAITKALYDNTRQIIESHPSWASRLHRALQFDPAKK